MALASFPLLIKRWKKSHLYYDSYNRYIQLFDYLPEEEFKSRLKVIDEHVEKEYPHIWIDSFLFLFAISCVIGAACFSIAARAVNLSLWYPLILLAVPFFIGIVTTKRRNMYDLKLKKYYESLQGLLKEFNSTDVTRHVKWTIRKLREGDTSANFHLPDRLFNYNINFVISIVQIDPEIEMCEQGEHLPPYDTSMGDVVLDIGPAVQQIPGNRSEYIDTPLSIPTVLAHPLPPEYENHSIEMNIITPPPAYLTNNRNNT